MIVRVLCLSLLFVSTAIGSNSSPLAKDLFKAEEIVRGLVVDIKESNTDTSSVILDVHYSLNHEKEEIEIFNVKVKDWQIGEQVVVFLNKRQDKHFMHLERLGKYVVRRLSEQEVLFNQGDYKDFYSKLDWMTLQKLLRVHREDFFQVHKDRTVFNHNPSTRKPASVEDMTKDSVPGSAILWIALFFGLIGGLYTLSHKYQD